MCNGEAGKYLLPPPPAKKFRVSSLRCAWKQLLELVVGATKYEGLGARVFDFIPFSSDHTVFNLLSKT